MSIITGSTVGATNPRPDWAQNDPTKADYIKNKPGNMSLPDYTEEDYGKVLSPTAEGVQWVESTDVKVTIVDETLDLSDLDGISVDDEVLIFL